MSQGHLEKSQAMAAKLSDNEYWLQPPLGEAGDLPWVDLWLSIEKVGPVDTVAATAFVKVTTEKI